MSASKLEVKLHNDLEVTFTRVFHAPRRLVFAAHTQPELIRQWLLGPPGWTMPVCEVDLRVAGKFRYVWRNEQGHDMGMGGIYREIVAPERIVHSELFDEDWTGGETLCTTEFSESGGKTTMRLTVRYASAAARDAALKTGMTDGMEMGYERLDELLSRG
jgi:uncharacterized protein YndB with AHSA1/START domain